MRVHTFLAHRNASRYTSQYQVACPHQLPLILCRPVQKPNAQCQPGVAGNASKPGLETGTLNLTSTAKESFDIMAKMEFLREDLTHLFDDKGIDASAYEAIVDFRDPITRHTSLSGYLLNIAFLRAAFDPRFTLHDMRCTAPDAITTRWTMSMRFTPAAALPSAKFWNPTITFTGTSTYVFNPASDKIFRHIDTWDSINRQEFFSVEGFMDFLRQLLSLHSAPALDTPQYTVLRRARDYEVRHYEPYLVAEAAMEAAAGAAAAAASNGREAAAPAANKAGPNVTAAPSSTAAAPAAAAGDDTAAALVNPAGPETAAFNSLAAYIFGGNQASKRMSMTTPVFSDTRGAMRFVIAGAEDASSLPAPTSPAISLGRVEGGLWAVRRFGGRADEAESSRQAQALRDSLTRDGLNGASPDRDFWVLARYNDPATPPAFRRNEAMIPLEQFDIWQ